jgi:hypothetical protein
MIHAYAIEPLVVVAWSERRAYRFVWDKFGIGTPRVLLDLPVAWEADVMTAAAGERLSELRMKRLDELLLTLRKGKVHRPRQAYKDAASWLENAEVEYRRLPFAAIIAMANPRRHSAVIVETDLGDPKDPRWAVPTAATPPRTAPALAGAVTAMLANCAELHIVDPHFGPETRRHVAVLKALLRVAASSSGAAFKVTVHCSDKSTLSFFETSAASMSRWLPHGVTVSFKRWEQRPGGEKFHNRYLLTDIGGVTFGVGLDEGKVTQTEDINLMNAAQYALRWSQFAGARVSLDLVDEPTPILGRRRTSGR